MTRKPLPPVPMVAAWYGSILSPAMPTAEEAVEHVMQRIPGTYHKPAVREEIQTVEVNMSHVKPLA